MAADWLGVPSGLLGGRLLTRKTLSLLAGPPDAGKTFLALKLADAAVNGGMFAGFQVEQVRTLFISEEMVAEEFRERLMEFHRGPAKGLRLCFQQGLNLNNWYQGGEKIKKLLDKEGRPDLVIVDALQEILGGFENNNDNIIRVLKGLRDLARGYDCAILVVDHFGKPGEFAHGAHQIRGASAKFGLAANIFLAEYNDDGKRVFKFEKTRRSKKIPPLEWELYQRADDKLDCIFYRDGEELGESPVF